MEDTMKTALILSALAAGVFVVSTASFAQTFAAPQYPYPTSARNWSYQGQYPLQPSLSDRTAQPECGFAATEDWGPNGFQWCDPKSMNPRPRIYRSDAFGQFVPSDRAGSARSRGGRRGASKFKVHAEAFNSAAAPVRVRPPSVPVAAQPLEFSPQGRF
jgi:hypothetical protein